MEDSLDAELRAELERISRHIDAIVDKIRQSEPVVDPATMVQPEQPLP